MRVAVQAEFKLLGVLKKDDGYPRENRSRSEEEPNRSVRTFRRELLREGTFEQALRELGWHVVPSGAVAHREESLALPAGGFRFPVPIPFGFEKPAGCHD